ncbi:unnamed protein product [Didymodactylos carnosus]|uniref:Uncharacterized protein n=1 Tax=Didymodactylos carnosus TaxID=1234261 RepID=A0A815NSI5_9BILA|nr:unnamed protein product [Didymodactylos carnosus]CAF1437454.1 unnamed protein product [Didymodactylos carnosus]CAF4213285.1 unnamed protein product [Didymodactylos carnosus]CAF4314773.1 unnamed protein product [Didymodactylos carnosus]
MKNFHLFTTTSSQIRFILIVSRSKLNFDSLQQKPKLCLDVPGDSGSIAANDTGILYCSNDHESYSNEQGSEIVRSLLEEYNISSSDWKLKQMYQNQQYQHISQIEFDINGTCLGLITYNSSNALVFELCDTANTNVIKSIVLPFDESNLLSLISLRDDQFLLYERHTRDLLLVG